MYPFSSHLEPDTQVLYLRSLPAIRQRCSQVFEQAQVGQLNYFDYHPEKESELVDFCITLIQRDYGTDYASIPPHGRWRHFDVGGHTRVEDLLYKWRTSSPELSPREICKRLFDLFLVSVLLDAGAGNIWKYREPTTGEVYSRSEGLAIASLHMFQAGLFSGDSTSCVVNAAGLEKLSVEQFAQAMQANPESNPLAGVDGRCALLSRLASVLRSHPEFFGVDGRPGDMLDFLEPLKRDDPDTGKQSIHVTFLWHVLMDGLTAIWPDSRTKLKGTSLGDVWPCEALRNALCRKCHWQEIMEGDDLVPFHKLSQWLCYSLIEVLQKIMKWDVDGMGDMTGLPEYRNGGLLVDFGVLTLKPSVIQSQSSHDIPRFSASHPAIIEWRAMTVIELDRIAEAICSKITQASTKLSLPQILESATWKGGREIAKAKRANGGPPIEIESDGTLF
ncbi:DUF1688-domain-containing protein [Calocera cornea HHB12733]|uniref:DUF1688-domain-containing protein n=1 Tax=Calocera cornea HHB12733 TaxID=1353952 RepID=A0A165HGI3_9BASI|nr:DUF1688-domain-containing protein [Calocera cornea HHB12733]